MTNPLSPQDNFDDPYVIVFDDPAQPYQSGAVPNDASEILLDNPLIGYGYKPVWWSYTPDVSGAVAMATAPSQYGNRLVVFTGTAENQLHEVAQAATPPVDPPRSGTLNVDLQAATEYRIAIFCDADYNDTYQLSLSGQAALGPALHDTLPEAEVITITSPHGSTYTSEQFSNRASEILLDNPLARYGYKPLWWSYTPTIASPNVMTVYTAASDYGTTLVVFTGNPSPAGLTEVASVSTPLVEPQPGAHMDVPVTANTTYYIAIFSHEDYVDSYQLTLTGPNTNTFPLAFRLGKSAGRAAHWEQVRTDLAGPLRLRLPGKIWHYQCSSALPGARPLSLQTGGGWEVVAWLSPYAQQVTPVTVLPQGAGAARTFEPQFNWGDNVLRGSGDAASDLRDGGVLSQSYDPRYAVACFPGARVQVHARAGNTCTFVTFKQSTAQGFAEFHFDVDFASTAEVLVYFYADAGGHPGNLIGIEQAAQTRPGLALPDADGNYGPLVNNYGDPRDQFNKGYTPTPFSGVATAPSGTLSCRIQLHVTILEPLPETPLMNDFFDPAQIGRILWWDQSTYLYLDAADIQPG